MVQLCFICKRKTDTLITLLFLGKVGLDDDDDDDYHHYYFEQDKKVIVIFLSYTII